MANTIYKTFGGAVRKVVEEAVLGLWRTALGTALINRSAMTSAMVRSGALVRILKLPRQ